jgi:glucose dehydrogenase
MARPAVGRVDMVVVWAEHRERPITPAMGASVNIRYQAALGTLAALAALVPTATASSFVNWPSYLDGLTHQSYAAQATAITPSNAASLAQAWHFMPGAPPVKALGYALNASPTVQDGMIYIGGNNGTFYAINETTGAVVWKRAIGYVNPTKGPCGPRGTTSTAAVAPAPGTGTPTST